MTLGARLRQRLDALSSGRLKLAALAVLLVYAITIFCSVVVQVTMTIAAVAKDPVIVAAADSVRALLVCGVMVWAAWELATHAVPDLLDRSTGHIAGPALERAADALPAGFSLESFRSRGTPHAARTGARSGAGLRARHRRGDGPARRAVPGSGTRGGAARVHGPPSRAAVTAVGVGGS